MKRFLMDELIKWKNNRQRKPLILQGGRQVGKTWLLKEFARNEYKNSCYLLFDQNKQLAKIFSNPSDMSFIIRSLAAIYGNIGKPDETLFIFDEIQACPEAMTSLKYFHELAPEYNIVAAGSLLGISEHSDYAFPVGKVDFFTLYPLTFMEFLLAMGKDGIAKAISEEDHELLEVFRQEMDLLLNQYIYVGGMPEVVQAFADSKGLDYKTARKIQDSILKSYDLDFSKHIKSEIDRKRTEAVWNAIPRQLAKENKKFIFSAIKGSRRASDYENALQWLKNAGLIYQIPLLRTQKIPTSVYEEKSIFKIYMIDIGLLGAKAGLNHNAIISGSTLFVEFKGALAEQYTCQELVAEGEFGIHYYANENSSNEVEFLIDNGLEIIPVEIKSGINVKAKSLKAYMEKFHPKLSFRVSRKGYEEQDNLINLPLAEISNIGNIVKRKVKI